MSSINTHIPFKDALVFKEVTLAYRQQLVLNKVNGHLRAGSLTAIVGENGCGKSTLVKAIAGIIKPTSGYIERLYKKSEIAYLAQLSEIDRSFPITVFDFVAYGLWAEIGAFNGLTGAQKDTVNNSLAAVGMGMHSHRLIGELSGGQFQRIRFAQLALQQVELFLLDEPFTGVDEHTTTDLMCLLHYWHEQGKTVVAVLHDLDLVQKQFPSVITLGDGRLLGWGDTPEQLTRYRDQTRPLNTEHKALAKQAIS